MESISTHGRNSCRSETVIKQRMNSFNLIESFNRYKEKLLF